VEPDSSSDCDTAVDQSDNSDAVEYCHRKKMLSIIVRYFVHSSQDQQVDMQVEVSEAVQLH